MRKSKKMQFLLSELQLIQFIYQINLFKELGTDTTTAIRMFLTQAVAHNGFPFEIKKISENPYLPLSEEQLLQKLELSRKHAEQGQYRNADDVISDMRAKYGL